MQIRYINTDLDLEAAYDLNDLARLLEERHFVSLHVTQREEGQWTATLELETDYAQPEEAILAMLDGLESLAHSARQLWEGCRRRVFNIGYECGEEPRRYLNGLTNSTLLRIATAGFGLCITLYPPYPPN